MILTKEQVERFEVAARPLVEFLNGLSHPHVTAIVDGDRAELLEGIASIKSVAAAQGEQGDS